MSRVGKLSRDLFNQLVNTRFNQVRWKHVYGYLPRNRVSKMEQVVLGTIMITLWVAPGIYVISQIDKWRRIAKGNDPLH